MEKEKERNISIMINPTNKIMKKNSFENVYCFDSTLSSKEIQFSEDNMVISTEKWDYNLSLINIPLHLTKEQTLFLSFSLQQLNIKMK